MAIIKEDNGLISGGSVALSGLESASIATGTPYTITNAHKIVEVFYGSSGDFYDYIRINGNAGADHESITGRQVAVWYDVPAGASLSCTAGSFTLSLVYFD